MADSSLTRQQALTLLNKLGHDDAFRDRFEKSPSAGLKEIGVPSERIAGFSAEALAPFKLAPKEKFQQLHQQISSQPTNEWLCMIIPQFRIDA
jgi:putative modified peptide